MITVERLVERWEDLVSAVEQIEVELHGCRLELRAIAEHVGAVGDQAETGTAHGHSGEPVRRR